MILSAEDADFIRTFKNSAKQVESLEKKLNKTATALGKTGGQAGKMKGEVGGLTDSITSGLGKLVGPAGIAAGIAGAFALASKAITEADNRAKEAAATINQNADAVQRLIQVSGSLGDFEANRAIADQITLKTGISERRALGIAFANNSFGLPIQDLQAVSKLSATDSPEQAVKTVGEFKGIFSKEKLTGEEIINSTLAAAKKSKFDFTQISTGAVKAADLFRGAGGSSADLLASLSELSTKDTTPEELATKLKAVGKVLQNKGAVQPGKDIFQNLEAFSKDSEEFEKAMKDSEFRQGAGKILESLPAIRQRRAEILAARAASGTPNAPLDSADYIQKASREPLSVLRLRQSQARLRISEREAGIEENFQQASLNRIRARSAENGDSAIDRMVLEGGLFLGDVLGVDGHRMEQGVANYRDEINRRVRKPVLEMLESLGVDTSSAKSTRTDFSNRVHDEFMERHKEEITALVNSKDQKKEETQKVEVVNKEPLHHNVNAHNMNENVAR